MAKVRVYELAKSLGKDSKEIIELLKKNGIEVKNHMSSVTDEDAAKVKARYTKNSTGNGDKPVSQAKATTDHTEKKTVEADNVGGWVETSAEGFIGKSIAKILSSRFGVGGSSFRTEQKSGYVDTVPFGAFNRSIFNKVGLFNERLLRSEDNDINARIIESGGKIYISEEIHSIYYCRDKISALLLQGIQNGNALFRTIKMNPKAMQFRHFVPFCFLLSLVFLPVIGIFVPLIKKVFFIELICYGLIDFYYSFIKKERRLGFITFWLYPLFHVFYGLGSLLGLVGVEMY